MQRRGLVKRFGYGEYGLPGYGGPLPMGANLTRPAPAQTATLLTSLSSK